MKIKRLEPTKGRRVLPHETGERRSTDHRRPIFSLENMVKTHCVSACEKDDQAALAQKLYEMSQLSWNDLRQAPRHGQGYENIRTNAISPLPTCVTPDVRLIAFRFSGKKPMVGYREDEIFYLICLDHDYSLYDHG
jgi:hypothetical protein